MGFSARALLPAHGLVAALWLFSSSVALAVGTRPVGVAAGVNTSFDHSLPSLAFAEADAERFAHTMATVGNVPARSIRLLQDPTVEEFVDAVRFQLRANSGHDQALPVRLILYFSGHADERGLHFSRRCLKSAHDLRTYSKRVVR